MALVGKALVLDGYSLNGDNRRNAQGHLRYRCNQSRRASKCKFTAWWDGDGGVVVRTTGEHSCGEPDQTLLERRQYRAALKTAAVASAEAPAQLLLVAGLVAGDGPPDAGALPRLREAAAERLLRGRPAPPPGAAVGPRLPTETELSI